MRQALAFITLTLLLTSLACHGKARRNLRPAEVQDYELPARDAAWTMNPPEYQKEDELTRPAKGKDNNSPPNRGIGAGGMSGIGTGAPGGVN